MLDYKEKVKENKKVLIQKEKDFLNQVPDKEHKPQFIKRLTNT